MRNEAHCLTFGGKWADEMQNLESSKKQTCKEQGRVDIQHTMSDYDTLEKDIHTIELDDHKIGLMVNLLIETLDKDGMHVAAMVMLKLVRHMTRSNFQMEEKIMLERKYPKMESHVSEHCKLIDYIDGLIVMLDMAIDENDVDSGTVSQFITRWHAQHVVNSDGALITYLRGIVRQSSLPCAEVGHG